MSNYNKELFIEVLKADNVIEAINSNIDNIVQIAPEIANMFNFEHKHPHHHLDVWEHTLLAMSKAPNNFDIRLSLLLHDIGKPRCYQTDGGIRHFKGHPGKSANISKRIISRLGFSQDYINTICNAIRCHDTPLFEEDILANPQLANLVFEIQKCDAMAHSPKYNQKRLQYLVNTAELFRELSIPQEYTIEIGLEDNLNELSDN